MVRIGFRARVQLIFELHAEAMSRFVLGLCICAWGVYAIVGDEPANIVAQVVQPWVYKLWVWLHVIAPIVALAGVLARDKLRGMWLMWAAKASIGIAMCTYVYAGLAAHSVTYGTFIMSGLAAATLGIMATRDIIRILHAEGYCDRKGHR